jgi:hypothetical protein
MLISRLRVVGPLSSTPSSKAILKPLRCSLVRSDWMGQAYPCPTTMARPSRKSLCRDSDDQNNQVDAAVEQPTIHRARSMSERSG